MALLMTITLFIECTKGIIMENIWTSSSGRIELDLTMEQASKGYHTGKCDGDILELRSYSEIEDQLQKLDPLIVKSELKEMGAWDDLELSNHEDNLDRLLWIACGDLVEMEVSDD